MARRDERGVRLLTRNGYDFADRFPLITQAVEVLPVRSCFIDGEAIVVNSDGLSVYDLLRYRQHDGAAVLCAFDLIELDGEDFRNAPIEQRKDLLANLLRRVQRSQCGITLNEHYEGDGATIYEHACRFGCEGIVSKRLGSHPIAPAALTTGSRSRIRRRPPLSARRRKIGETSDGLAADEGTPALREGLILRKNITFNFAGQPKGIAWLSFQPDGSISCGLRDRTYVSPRFQDRISLWNVYNRGWNRISCREQSPWS
jgi:hypothetical protein